MSSKDVFMLPVRPTQSSLITLSCSSNVRDLSHSRRSLAPLAIASSAASVPFAEEMSARKVWWEENAVGDVTGRERWVAGRRAEGGVVV